MELNAMIFIGMIILLIFFIFMSMTTKRKVYNLFAIGILATTYMKFSEDMSQFVVLFIVMILWLIYDIFRGGGEIA